MRKNTNSAKLLKLLKRLYEKTGPSAVYKKANEMGLPYSNCIPCNASTPTVDKNECALCGSAKVN